MLKKLSDELREAREKKELTPEILAKTIKMDLKYLKRMEAGDYSFFPDVYLKAFIRSYAKAVDLNAELYAKKFVLAREGRSIDEAEAAPTVQIRHPDAQPRQPADDKTPLKENVPQFSQPTLVKSYEEQKEQSPKTRRRLNVMQKRILIFGGISFLIIVLVTYGVYRANLNQTIVYEGPATTTPEEIGKSRYEENPRETLIRTDDSLVLRMEFSDLCWVRVIPDSIIGESSENTFNKNSDPAEYKAAKNFIVSIGNPPALRLLLNNKDLAFEKNSNNPIRLLVTKDSTRTLSMAKPSDDNNNTARDKKKEGSKIELGR